MFRYKMVISYEGTNYYGFQKQTNKITIEEKLLEALYQIHRKEIKLVGSGRTDRGVHAIGMVAHFDSELDLSDYRFTKALNTYLPNDIRIKSVIKVDNNFHARYSAKSKTYQYIITKKYNVFRRNLETYLPYNLDIKMMKQALNKFIGKHDFFGFSSYIKGKPTVKEIYEANLKEENDKIIITIKGDGFLKYMVRRIVGTLVEIGRDKKDISVIDEIFKTKDGSLSGKTIEPEGLYLLEVNY